MKRYLLIIPAFIILCAIGYYFINKPVESSEEYNYKKNTITVKLEGSVLYPNSYEVLIGTSLKDLIEKAGGLLENADTADINLNQKLEDNKTINIPGTIDIISEKVNINKANFQDLLSIPYISERIASSIIIYRQTNGLFNSIEELLNVKYIGNATFDKIKDYVTI
jgi:competence protein ComEA